MYTGKILKISSACSLMITIALSSELNNEDMIKSQATEAIKTVGGKLKQTVSQKMKEQGAAEAALFCSTSATDLAKEVSKTLPEGIKVKRITDKPRNPNNLANEEQLKVLQQIKSQIKTKDKPQLVIKEISPNHYQVYQPITMGGKCLTCHGDESMRNKNAYEIISSKYPNDKATGYKEGDFRGAFLVDIVK